MPVVRTLRTRTNSHDLCTHLDGRSIEEAQTCSPTVRRSEKPNKNPENSRKAKENPFGPWPSLPSAVYISFSRFLEPPSNLPVHVFFSTLRRRRRQTFGRNYRGRGGLGQNSPSRIETALTIPAYLGAVSARTPTSPITHRAQKPMLLDRTTDGCIVPIVSLFHPRSSLWPRVTSARPRRSGF